MMGLIMFRGVSGSSVVKDIGLSTGRLRPKVTPNGSAVEIRIQIIHNVNALNEGTRKRDKEEGQCYSGNLA